MGHVTAVAERLPPVTGWRCPACRNWMPEDVSGFQALVPQARTHAVIWGDTIYSNYVAGWLASGSVFEEIDQRWQEREAKDTLAFVVDQCRGKYALVR